MRHEGEHSLEVRDLGQQLDEAMRSVGHKVRRVQAGIREFTVEMELTREGAEFLRGVLDDGTGRPADGGGAVPASPPGRRETETIRMGSSEKRWCGTCKAYRSTWMNGERYACNDCDNAIPCLTCGTADGPKHVCYDYDNEDAGRIWCGSCAKMRAATTRTRSSGTTYLKCTWCGYEIACYACSGTVNKQHSCSWSVPPEPGRENDIMLRCRTCRAPRSHELIEDGERKLRRCRSCGTYQACAECSAFLGDGEEHDCPLHIEVPPEKPKQEWVEGSSPHGGLGVVKVSIGHGAELDIYAPVNWHEEIRRVGPRLRPGPTFRQETHTAVMALSNACHAQEWDAAGILFTQIKGVAV